jgi:hypothetical protein
MHKKSRLMDGKKGIKKLPKKIEKHSNVNIIGESARFTLKIILLIKSSIFFVPYFIRILDFYI